MPANIHLTTPILWICTIILFVLDMLLAFLIYRLISHEQFRKMHKMLGIASGIFFLFVWTSVMIWSWDWFYAYIFPSWARMSLPVLFGIGYALLGAGIAWLSQRLKGNPAIIWCVLGGVEGLLSHLYAIYGLGAATKPPIMQGTDPFAVLVFAIFEKAFYWSLILIACWVFSIKTIRKTDHAPSIPD